MNEVLEHFRRIKALLASSIYTKEDLKKMSPKIIKKAYEDLLKTQNSRRDIK